MKKHLFRRYSIAATILFITILIAGYFSNDGLLVRTLDSLQNFKEASEGLREDILAYGPRAPFFFMLVQVLQVVFAPIPGEASGLLGGYVFGAFTSFIYSSIGLTLGSAIAFGIGRLLNNMIGERMRKTAVYRKFDHLVHRRDFLIPFILFIVPGFPKDSLSYVLGMSAMPLPAFLFVTAIGRMPGTLMLSLQGAEAYNGNYVRLVILMLLSILVTLPCMIYRHRILSLLEKRTAHSPTDPEQGIDS